MRSWRLLLRAVVAPAGPAGGFARRGGAGTVLCVPPVGRDTVHVTSAATVATFIHHIGVLLSDHDGGDIEAVHKEEAS